VILGRTNQKFDMPREIRHDERMELSVFCSQKALSGRSGPETGG
jgi:hypothetical protein